MYDTGGAHDMLEITLLGDQRVGADGTLVEGLRSPRTFGLLAYLLLHAGAPQLRQHMAGLFWPETSDAQARTTSTIICKLLHTGSRL